MTEKRPKRKRFHHCNLERSQPLFSRATLIAVSSARPLRQTSATDDMSKPGGERRLTAVEIFAKYDEDGSNYIDVGEIEV